MTSDKNSEQVKSVIKNDKIKDNPVPSIDNKDIGYLISLVKKDIEKDTPFKDIKYLILKKLQNGVETDNEQPNECKCGGDNTCMCS